MLSEINNSLVEKESKNDFLEDVLIGLSASPRNLPCKYLYDQRGSQLFDEICELEEYYVTRTELEIMRRYAPEMANEIGAGAVLVEYGSGSSLKTPLLLDQLIDLVAYVPVDISLEHLHESAAKLSDAYPELAVSPVCADFIAGFELPHFDRIATGTAFYFPGSTIGNFEPSLANHLLKNINNQCGPGGSLLIGIDLQKKISTIEAAYNDAKGVTASFNLNMLNRINLELGGDIKLEQFEHVAKYNEKYGRVEIGLQSLQAQVVEIEGKQFAFEKGEEIHTEYSHKYTIDGFAEIASEAGLEFRRAWTDPNDLFAVLHFVVGDQTL